MVQVKVLPFHPTAPSNPTCFFWCKSHKSVIIMAHDSGAVRFIVYCADKSFNEGAVYSIADFPIMSIVKLKKIYFFFLTLIYL